MPVLDFEPLRIETAAIIRGRLDADVNLGIEQDDPAYLDTTEGGVYWDMTQGFVLICERLWDFAATVMPAACFPTTAWGEYLDLHGITIGLDRKEEVKATGEVTFSGLEGSLIATGTQVAGTQTDPDVDPPIFQTTESVVLGAVPAPQNPDAAIAGGSEGQLGAADYYYVITADVPDGETIGSEEVTETVPAQTLSAPTGLGGNVGTSGSLASDDYYYVVTALNANGETLASAEIMRTVVGPNGSVALTWNAVTDATGYRVYRGTSPAGEDTFYFAMTNSYTDTGAAGTAGSPPATNTAQYGSIVLTWSLVTGATSYRIYRSTAPGNETMLVSGLREDLATWTDLGDLAPGVERPPTNTVAIEALEPGVAGNVAVGTITELLSAVSGITAVTNEVATSGGAEVESDDSYRSRLLLAYSTPGGAGNIGDYMRWALDYPGVGFASVEPIWNGAGTVRVTITDTENNPVSAETAAGLQALLDPVPGLGHGLAPIGAIVTVSTPTAVAVAVQATLTLASGYSLDGGGGEVAVRQAVGDALSAYVDTLRPGDDVVLAHVVGQFFTVDGVIDVTGVTLNGEEENLVIKPPGTPIEVARLGDVILA